MKGYWLSLCGCLVFGSNVTAAPNNLNVFFDTAAEFESVLIEKIKKNELPHIEDGNVASLIATLINQSYIDTEQYELNELNTLLDVCDKVTLFVNTYVNFKARQQFLVGIQNSPPTSYQDILDGNIRNFQGVLKELQPFQLRCVAAEIPLLEQFMGSLKQEERTPVRINGVKKARQGILQMYAGLLTGIGNETLDESYRLELLSAISESSDAFARLMPVVEREYVAKLVNENMRHTSKEFEDELGVVLHAMSTKECIKLCEL